MLTLKLFFITFSIVVLSACQTTETLTDATEKVAYEEFVVSGEKLPLDQITDVNGITVDLGNPDKRKLVVLFATWCSDSNRALKALNQSEILKDDTIEVIAIAREESIETVKAWRDEHGINVPLAADPDRSVYKKFAAAGIPRLITVAKNNQIIKMNLAEGENQLELIDWY
ncbi:TlpA family protein disulfide reductase [Aliikangiella coralliicola]|uniref:TlpA family protein disulfide reductase n=1 Tax=Aliikangiella coralliicola TaxID=2592383 RepID=A0A545U7K7_9GAMM|nr:TlpA disulfide reductase family protein [Aliikangiella coralliicola]TQV85456.1 TlpA family protein disulfide reductase [Aliikangiella coralliicola]